MILYRNRWTEQKNTHASDQELRRSENLKAMPKEAAARRHLALALHGDDVLAHLQALAVAHQVVRVRAHVHLWRFCSVRIAFSVI